MSILSSTYTPAQDLSILEELRGKSLFSKFDIRAGYNNIRVLAEDTYKTGFQNKQRVIRMDCHAIRIM